MLDCVARDPVGHVDQSDGRNDAGDPRGDGHRPLVPPEPADGIGRQVRGGRPRRCDRPLRGDAKKCDKIKVLSVSNLLAQAIDCIHTEGSISSLFV